MHTAVQALSIASSLLFAVLAAVAVYQWIRRRDMAAGWVALTFLSLGVLVTFGRLLPATPHSFGAKLAARVEIELLVLFPYLLYRFATAFRPPSLCLFNTRASRPPRETLGFTTRHPPILAMASLTELKSPGNPKSGTPTPAVARHPIVRYLSCAMDIGAGSAISTSTPGAKPSRATEAVSSSAFTVGMTNSIPWAATSPRSSHKYAGASTGETTAKASAAEAWTRRMSTPKTQCPWSRN